MLRISDALVMAFPCWSGGIISGRDSAGFGAGEPVIGEAAAGAMPAGRNSFAGNQGRYSAACDDGGRMVATPSASVAEIVVRTIRRASCAGHGRPRCMVARLSHITTSPLLHWWR